MREAMAMGLDRDDTVIRRRLRQKLEFASDDSVDATPATDAELQAWMDAHPDTFRSEPEVAFRQVYVSQERGQAAADAEARRLLDTLRAAGPSVAIESLGDPIMLPREVDRSSRSPDRARVRRRVRRRRDELAARAVDGARRLGVRRPSGAGARTGRGPRCHHSPKCGRSSNASSPTTGEPVSSTRCTSACSNATAS